VMFRTPRATRPKSSSGRSSARTGSLFRLAVALVYGYAIMLAAS
jgi:hypothetical protein